MSGDAAWGRAWRAPAKINLFLHVLGRRPDGYHRIQTAFQFLDHCDLLRFEPAPAGVFERPEGLPGLAAEADLAVRAARLLDGRAGGGRGVRIRVEKRIPAGGGLGGASSDAATTLVALNALWGLGLGPGALARLGLALGADVPVFVYGRAAWAEGVGERLTPVDFDEPDYLVVRPGCSVGTAEIFQAPELTRNSAPITISRFLSSGGGNDCLAVVKRRYPAVGEALEWLSEYGQARLTGTGSCVFAAVDDPARAAQALAALPAGWSGFAARGRNRSPLFDRADPPREHANGV